MLKSPYEFIDPTSLYQMRCLARTGMCWTELGLPHTYCLHICLTDLAVFLNIYRTQGRTNIIYLHEPQLYPAHVAIGTACWTEHGYGYHIRLTWLHVLGRLSWTSLECVLWWFRVLMDCSTIQHAWTDDQLWWCLSRDLFDTIFPVSKIHPTQNMRLSLLVPWGISGMRYRRVNLWTQADDLMKHSSGTQNWCWLTETKDQWREQVHF